MNFKRNFKFIIALCLLISVTAACAAPPAPGTSPKNISARQVVPVIRGDLINSISVEGNLVMPQAYDLRFGAPGSVMDVFVKEGDFVTAGTVLATLDYTSQQLDIQSANCELQQTLSNLYETIPSIQQTYGYPAFYPNASAVLASGWASKAVASAYELWKNGSTNEASAQLAIARSDLLAIKRIFRDAIENPYCGLGDTTVFDGRDETTKWMEYYPPDRVAMVAQWQSIIDEVNNLYNELEKTSYSIKPESSYPKPSWIDIITSSENLNRKVADNINRIRVQITGSDANTVYYPQSISEIKNNCHRTYNSINLCLDFYDEAIDHLDNAIKLIQQGKIGSPEFNSYLQSARHFMEICNSILGSTTLVLEHGLSLKNYQSYKVSLERASITLQDRQNTLLKSIIIAPFDGIIVNVGVNENDILSNLDYSSRSAVQIVDTSAIKFQGKVDEIDILKIQNGQKATLSVDAVPNRTFPGTVTFISPYGTKSTTGQVVKFDITIKLDPTDVPLKGGLTATADIVISTLENVLMVPLASVTTTPEGSFVEVVIDEQKNITEKRKVVTGAQNSQFVHIVSGLAENEKISYELKTGTAPVRVGFVPAGGGGPPPPR